MKNASADRAWADEAIRKVNAENNRSADTHLYSVPLPEHWGVQLYLKDESTHRCGGFQRQYRGLGGILRAAPGVAVRSGYDPHVAATSNGHYMDQFTYAERATDWLGNNNIAESSFGQLALEEHPVPRWIVVGAGTGGTSAAALCR